MSNLNGKDKAVDPKNRLGVFGSILVCRRQTPPLTLLSRE